MRTHAAARAFVFSAITCLLLAVAVAHAQSPPRLPQPTGSYGIGTTRFALTDLSRPETFTDAPDDKRELLVRAWYPAQVKAGATPEPMWGRETAEIARHLARSLNLPEAAFAGLAQVPSHSYTDAPLTRTNSRFPVLVFSHGYNPGFLAQNTAQMEHLASHGYVVFSIGHTYETLVNVLPDGRITPFSQDRKAAFIKGSASLSAFLPKYLAAADPRGKEELLRGVLREFPLLDESLLIWSHDVSFVLDEIERMNAGRRASIFRGKLDMNRVGIFGMSFGGATAGHVCATDRRCKAGANLDGLQFGAPLDRPLARPFMFMNAGVNADTNVLFYERARAEAYHLAVTGAYHFNFTDFSLFSDYKAAGIIGPIDGAAMESVMNDYLLAFFDKHLRGRRAPLLDAPSTAHSAVRFKSRNTSVRK